MHFLGTDTATVCGHEYPVHEVVNDLGELVLIRDVYPDPDATPFRYDAPELCYACYIAKMDRKPIMSARQVRDPFTGR